MFSYYPKGVCSRQIILHFDGDTIKDCKFMGGCSGNLQGVSRLVKGRNIDEVISSLEGIQCRNNTSCPDQLAKALKAYKEQQENK